MSPNPKHFSNCDVCDFEFRLEFVEGKKLGSQCKFVFLVARDIIALIVAINLVTKFHWFIYISDYHCTWIFDAIDRSGSTSWSVGSISSLGPSQLAQINQSNKFPFFDSNRNIFFRL